MYMLKYLNIRTDNLAKQNVLVNITIIIIIIIIIKSP